MAEIDSLTLLMSCVYDGMGVTIKPMSALQHECERGKRWRALSISNARIKRRNFIYSIAKDLLTPAAAAVAIEPHNTAHGLINSGAWRGVSLVEAEPTVQAAE